jgi:hypothetical protein
MSPADLEKRYPGRRDNAVVVNITLDRDAAKLLREYADTPRSHGRFVAELLFAFDRQRRFQDFLEGTGRKELRRLCRQVAREARREEG